MLPRNCTGVLFSFAPFEIVVRNLFVSGFIMEEIAKSVAIGEGGMREGCLEGSLSQLGEARRPGLTRTGPLHSLPVGSVEGSAFSSSFGSV